jgi:hypothetical protein
MLPKYTAGPHNGEERPPCPTAFRGTRSSRATERRQLWPASTVAPVKHNGRSRVYRVLFASRSAFDACKGGLVRVSHANVAMT